MISTCVRVWDFLWRFSFFRFGSFHAPVGALNYVVAFFLFWYYGVDKYVATIFGHVVHVTLAFFYDRDVTFRAQEKRGVRTFALYWFNDVVSLCSILLTIYVLVDQLALHLILMQYWHWPEDQAIAAMRAVPAMIIGTSVTYGLNKIWTFNEEINSQSKLT